MSDLNTPFERTGISEDFEGYRLSVIGYRCVDMISYYEER
jgi:hypothetical protein